MVRRGTHTGVVQFVTDPNMGYGTVCKIGDYWFYFGGGITAEELEPDEYVKHFSTDEYRYYFAVLARSGCKE